MAATTKQNRDTLPADSIERQLAVQFNALVAQFDALLAKLDADAGVTDTDYASTLGTTVAKVGNLSGTAIS